MYACSGLNCKEALKQINSYQSLSDNGKRNFMAERFTGSQARAATLAASVSLRAST